MTTPPVDLCQKSKRQSSSNGLASDTTKFAKKIIPRLADYDIDPKTGFLPSSPAPLTRLSGTYFEPWELVMDDIQRLLLAGRLRERVAALPMLDTSMLGDSLREWQRACVVISFIAQAFIWGKNERAEQNLPRCLAIPWLEICRKLEVLPIISYATVELWNFKVLNPSAKWDLSNLSILHTFSGGMDEAWFYLVSIAIEAEGARALPAIVDALRAVDAGDLASLKFALTVIADVTESITKILGKMYEKNDPHIFFHRVRPFMNGWGENSDDMPDGVLYEGVTKKENLPNGLETDKGVFGKYAGASAGQSSLIHSLDAFLQVEHKPMHGGDPAKAVNAMLEMRRYMPGPHRRFIQAITDSFSVRDFIHGLPSGTEGAVELVELFNKCVEGMKAFRSAHIPIVTAYIIVPARRHKESQGQNGHIQNGLLVRGTGGTNLIPFLKQSRDETVAAKIEQ